MLSFPDIDPVLVEIGPLKVRWYGLMYVLGFMASYFLVQFQIRKHKYALLAEHFENINLVLILSVIVGGRLGYVLFYNLSYYSQHPLEIFATWTGGMSFHGACFALIVSGWWYTRKIGLDFWKTADIYVATIPVGLGLGRIGNYITGELFGRATLHSFTKHLSRVPFFSLFSGLQKINHGSTADTGLTVRFSHSFLSATDSSGWE